MSNTKPLYKKWWFWVLAVFALFIFLIIITPTPEIQENEPEQVAEEQQVIFNAPYYLELTIDDVRDELGMPLDESFIDPTEEQVQLGTKEWTNEYNISDHVILIDWDVETREVTGIFIGASEPANEDGVSDITKDWEQLVALLGVSPDNNGYNINPVKANKYPDYYTGVEIKE